MSRFHEEFFKNGSPEHDKLMIKCLSQNGMDKILNAVDTTDAIRRYDKPESAIICNLSDGRRCVNLGASVDIIKKNVHYGEMNCEKRYTGYGRTQCRHVNQCMFGINNNVPTDVILSPIIQVSQTVRKETEVIIRNGTFIIGYADAIIDINYRGSVSYQVEDGWIWKDVYKIDENAKILLEAKPKLLSIGEVIRQLKTYKEQIELRSSRVIQVLPVIATYTELDQDSIDYLANENIKVVVFEAA
jgi:hypothetical protein